MKLRTKIWNWLTWHLWRRWKRRVVDFDFRMSDYEGTPIIVSDDTVKDTRGKIFLIDVNRVEIKRGD